MDEQATVLFLPGLLSDGVVWRAAIDRLSPRMPVAVGNLTTQPSITAMAEDMLAQHSGPLYVAGHSMGGRVALEMTRLAPGRVQRLALLNTGMNPKKEGEEISRQEKIDRAYRDGMQVLAAAWLPPMLHPDRSKDPEIMTLLTQMVLRHGPEVHERQMRALTGRPDATQYADQITCPTLLLVGRQDGWSPISQHEVMKALIPQSTLVIVEDAGHFAPVEQPEAVADALAAWAA